MRRRGSGPAALYIDVGFLKAACGWSRYKTRKGRTRYGCLNVPIPGPVPETLCYDFSPDRNGDISVNVRRKARDLDREFLVPLTDFRGFIISKNGWVRPLDERRSNYRERRNSRKGENWRQYAGFLMEYLDTFRGEEE